MPRLLLSLSPTGILPVLRTPTLYAEDNDVAGQAVGMAMQVSDADGRTFVSTRVSGLTKVKHSKRWLHHRFDTV
jgi:hypothetical protein